jgi:hypothetical protein
MGNGPRAFCAEGTVKTLIYICIRTVGGRTKNTFRKELLLKGKREMIILIIFLTKKKDYYLKEKEEVLLLSYHIPWYSTGMYKKKNDEEGEERFGGR